MDVLTPHSRLREQLGINGVAFLEHAAGAIHRILPHVELSRWQEEDWIRPGAVWASKQKTAISVTISIGTRADSRSRSLTAAVKRRRVPSPKRRAEGPLDERDFDICKRIVDRISEIVLIPQPASNPESLEAIRRAFDEYVIASHLEEHHNLALSVDDVLQALHTLSEQSYENKSLTFGCILDPGCLVQGVGPRFPSDFLGAKKYKALSDGFHTAYHLSCDGSVLGFVDLESFADPRKATRGFYPIWTEPVARASTSGRCGLVLSRQGDILVFVAGTLQFTYRYGRWQYWNHIHLVHLLCDRARATPSSANALNRVVAKIYRAALDVSFRRSGGLFVVLQAPQSLHEIVRIGDAIGDGGRSAPDAQFDAVVRGRRIQGLPRSVIVELAALDGAVVLDQSGNILAYGAVLNPRRAGTLRGTEGSRTKAAVGASNYGLAVKISADGDITVYHHGEEFIKV